MAKVTFDGPTKIISVNAGVTSLDVAADLYSEWKNWVQTSDNSKYLEAFRVVGGDPITDTRSLGSTFFITNGWRIRPPEENGRLTINGNLYTDPAGFSPVIPTIGSFSSVVEYSVSNLVDAVSSGEQVALQHAMYGDKVVVDPVNGIPGTAFPIGTFYQPSNNMADAITIADNEGLNTFHIHGTITLGNGVDLSGKIIEGTSPLNTDITIDAGAVLDNAIIRNAHITGTLDTNAWVEDCEVADLTYVDGRLINCGLTGRVQVAGTGAIFLHCHSTRLTSLDSTILDLNGSRNCSVIDYSGHLQIENMSGGTVGVSGQGNCKVTASVTGGMIHFQGDWKVTDQHTGAASIRTDYVVASLKDVAAIQAAIATVDAAAVWEELSSDHTTPGTKGKELKDALTLLKVLLAK